MPANLPPEAGKKWEKVMEAKTPEEKLRHLRSSLVLCLSIRYGEPGSLG